MEVQPIYAICALALLIGSVVAVFLWDRVQESFSASRAARENEELPEGNIRGFFFLLWVLILAAFISFTAPNLFRFSRLIQEGAIREQKVIAAIAALALPLVFFLLLGLGVRKKYMEWLSDLRWPEGGSKN